MLSDANPRAVIGFTKSHLIIHAIKILEKYRLVGVLMPVCRVSR